MNNSWIAVADQHELKLFVPETKHALRPALRRAESGNSQCFWVVLQPCHAQKVDQQLREGNATVALWLVDHLAMHIGRISPCQLSESGTDSEYVTIPDNHDKEWDS